LVVQDRNAGLGPLALLGEEGDDGSDIGEQNVNIGLSMFEISAKPQYWYTLSSAQRLEIKTIWMAEASGPNAKHNQVPISHLMSMLSAGPRILSSPDVVAALRQSIGAIQANKLRQHMSRRQGDMLMAMTGGHVPLMAEVATAAQAAVKIVGGGGGGGGGSRGGRASHKPRLKSGNGRGGQQ
jgi:hypothetical protein